MINHASPIPLYFQMAELLREAIRTGVYRAGSKLPTESEFCELYGVSRSVVRQALQSLARDNLIETERGRGAFVLERKVPIEMVQQLDPLKESMAKAGFQLTTRVIKLERIKAPAKIAEKIGDTSAIFIKRLRYADGIVFLAVHNYLPFSRASDLLQYDGLDNVSLYKYLADHYDIVATTGTRQVELVRLDDPTIADDLQVELQSYVLFNKEVTFDQDKKVVEYYESWHHPDRTKLTINLLRQY